MSRSLLACVGLVGTLACAFDSSGVGGEGSATLGTDAETTTATATTMPVDTSGADTTSVGTASATTHDSSDCVPGELGCPCDGGACNGELSCVDDECVASMCGDGVVQRGEECEPGLGGGKEAGCGEDCLFLRGARSIALGQEHTCAVTHDGTLRCWGDGDRGKLGLGGTDDIGNDRGEPASAPDVDAGDDVARVALGSSFSCALRVGGDVVCWGFRDAGRLGDGLGMAMEDIGDDPGETAATLGPLDIPGTVVDLAVGGSHACALRATNEIHCWGLGTGGRLGYANEMDVGGTNTPASVGPVMMPRNFTPMQIAAGAGHTCALSTGGDVLCWGDGVEGNLGAATTTPIGDDEPAAAGTLVELGGEATAIAAGSQHTCALMDDETIHCWGLGDHGRLGYGNQDSVGDDEPPSMPVPLPGPVRQISLGRAHTCAVIDESALCWGEGAQGKLGRGDTADLGHEGSLADASPILIDDDPDAVVVAIEAGGDHTCAILDGGRVRCWGLASAGQLGYGNDDKIGDDEPPDVAGDVVFD
jgi:alpha-tubulin suppressor-like RCC1 family protein